MSPVDGRYTNLVSARHAESAWSPDGKTIALADLPPDAIAPVSYNGDPDRVDRDANLLAASAGRLWTIDAPSAPLIRVESGPAPNIRFMPARESQRIRTAS